MTYSFLERIGQPAVDLANDREESIPFVVLSATFIPILPSRKCFYAFPRQTWLNGNPMKCFDA